MNFLMIYVFIGIIYSIDYTNRYIDENKKIFNNTTRSNRIKAIMISFFITLIIYPITMIEEIIKKTKNRKEKKK